MLTDEDEQVAYGSDELDELGNREAGAGRHGDHAAWVTPGGHDTR